MKIGSQVRVSPVDHPHLRGMPVTVVATVMPMGTTEAFLQVADTTGKRHWVRERELVIDTAPKETNMTATDRLDTEAKAIQKRTGKRYADALKEASINLSRAADDWLNEPRGVSTDLLSGPGMAAFEARAVALTHAKMRAGMTQAAAIDDTLKQLAGGQPTPLSLRATLPQNDDTFDELVARYATEHRVSLRDAVHQVGKLRPELAQVRR